jgi:phospholipase C
VCSSDLPDAKNDEYTFNQYGIRVPVILVSPWVNRCVDHTEYDHTSLLKYLTDKWQLGPLGARTATANSIAGTLKAGAPRTDTIGSIRVPFSELVAEGTIDYDEEPSKHHESMHILAAYLERELKQDESPLMAKTLSLAQKIELSYGHAKSSLGKALEALGRALAEDGRSVKKQRVDHTVGVAAKLLNTGRIGQR